MLRTWRCSLVQRSDGTMPLIEFFSKPVNERERVYKAMSTTEQKNSDTLFISS
jgi:hypothetical protein